MHQGPPKKVKIRSLDDFLEVMSKSVFQAGISWKVIANKWPGIRDAFRGFDIKAVAGFSDDDIDDLMEDPRVIRNLGKLEAVVFNARKILELDHKYGTFRKYLRSQDSFDATLKMIHKDFRFMGPTGTYMFLYLVGEKVIPHEEFERLHAK